MKGSEETRVKQIFSDIAGAPTLGHKPRILHVDVEEFQSRLDNSNLSEAEKAEYLHLIWSVVMEFIDLGYGVHPVQQICGKDQSVLGRAASQDEDLIESQDQNPLKTNRTSTTHHAGESEDA